MSGKAYTMKEMLQIVQYLIENKHYSEIKGRKMWMDFANTSLTNRTWQSLKETFLKRILPDISNPYYRLSKEQIVSFRQGYDVQKQGRNKLEIHTVSDNTDNEEGQQKDNEQQTNSHIKEGEKTGEDIKCSKITTRNRSSADTFVIEKVYETAEDIQKVLESPKPNNQLKETENRPKKIDLITYSEPLAPILQSVLNDFASDTSSDREPVMEIDERKPDTYNEENINQKEETVMEIANTENKPSDDAADGAKIDLNAVNDAVINDSHNSEIAHTPEPIERSHDDTFDKVILIGDGDKISEQPINNTENFDNETHFSTTKDSNVNISSETEKEGNNTKKGNDTENSSSMTDSLLPNNQEGLKTTIIQTEKNFEENNTNDETIASVKSPRKRTISENSVLRDNKKKRVVTTVEVHEIKTNSNKNVRRNSNVTEFVIQAIDEIIGDVASPNVEVIKAHKDNVPISKFNESTSSENTLLKENKQKEDAVVNENINGKSAQTKDTLVKGISSPKEQLNNTRDNNSEASEVEKSAPQTKTRRKVVSTNTQVYEGDVVLLLSGSEPDNSDKPKKESTKIVSHSIKSERNTSLANIFGFSSGGGTTSHKSRLKRKRSICHRKKNDTARSESSEWTSDGENEEYVSPPCERRGKQSKKLYKLKTSRLISLEEDNGLFALCGDKIIPIIKNGKIVKSVSYIPKNDSEDPDEAYWRLKYLEEKKKNDELKRLLDQSKEPSVSNDRTSLKRRSSSLCQHSDIQQIEAVTPGFENNSVKRRQCEVQTNTSKEEKIKIKFTKNNEEVHLEGHWPQIDPLLEKVMNIFHKETKPEQSSSKVLDGPVVKVNSSGHSTPVIITVDPEVREKVDIIEMEIFQEIEQRDKEEEPVEEPTDNVTKRAPRRSRKPPETPVTSQSNHSKLAKKDDEPKADEDKVQTVTGKPVATVPTSQKSEQTIGNKSGNVMVTRKTRASSSNTDVAPENLDKSPPKKYRTRLSINAKRDDDIDGMLFMLPPEKTTTPGKKTSSKTAQKNSKSLKNVAEIASPDSLSRISESTPGYHESDFSPIQLKRKKRLSKIVRSTKRPISRNALRSKRSQLGYHSDSSNSSCSQSKINRTQQTFSDIYKSESYKCLFPHRNRSSKRLDSIDELEAIENDGTLLRFNTVSDKEHTMDLKTLGSDVDNSSNLSMPVSPELSIVESISVKRDLMKTGNQPTINEIQCNNDKKVHTSSSFFLPDVDISVPLMQQSCEDIQIKVTPNVVHSNQKNKLTVSESLLNGIGSVKIHDNSSDSIDRQLEELLLESNRKDNTQYMEIDHNNAAETKKFGGNKRCSTPHKKRNYNKRKISKFDVLVEHKESLSYGGNSGGRASCPPLIQVFDDNDMDYEENIINKGKPKKDVIKVKITKPKLSKVNNYYGPYTDSDANDRKTAIFAPESDNSVKLIHNHSETCLHANECIKDRMGSLADGISHESDSMKSTNSSRFDINEFLRAEDRTNNVNDFQLFSHEYRHTNNENGSIHLSPSEMVMNCSLITEDLSDDTPSQYRPPMKPSKWYLLSEDETSKSNTYNGIPPSTGVGWGANLNHIFPVTCSVPNLSDITEASRENDDSRKPMDI